MCGVCRFSFLHDRKFNILGVLDCCPAKQFEAQQHFDRQIIQQLNH